MGSTQILCNHLWRHHLRENALRELPSLLIHEPKWKKQTRDVFKQPGESMGGNFEFDTTRYKGKIIEWPINSHYQVNDLILVMVTCAG